MKEKEILKINISQAIRFTDDMCAVAKLAI